MAMFFNESQINDWFYASDNIIKVYYNEAVCYYKINTSSPTPPTPTYQWVSYNEGDTVQTKLVYGVKLYIGLGADNEIDFQDTHQGGGVYFRYVADGDGWYRVDSDTGNEIDLSSYYDSSEGCYIVLFSDLGYGGLPIIHPAPDHSFEFDVDLYEEV